VPGDQDFVQQTGHGLPGEVRRGRRRNGDPVPEVRGLRFGEVLPEVSVAVVGVPDGQDPAADVRGDGLDAGPDFLRHAAVPGPEGVTLPAGQQHRLRRYRGAVHQTVVVDLLEILRIELDLRILVRTRDDVPVYRRGRHVRAEVGFPASQVPLR